MKLIIEIAVIALLVCSFIATIMYAVEVKKARIRDKKMRKLFKLAQKIRDKS